MKINYLTGVWTKWLKYCWRDFHTRCRERKIFCFDICATSQPRLCFYQTGSAWSVDQGTNKNHSTACNFTPTVTKFCVMWEGLSLPHDTKFGNCRCKIVDSRAFPSWSLIHGLRWSGLINAEPGLQGVNANIVIGDNENTIKHNETHLLHCDKITLCNLGIINV